MAAAATKRLIIGKVAGVYGVKGWVRIQSFTSPMENFLSYRQCELIAADGLSSRAVAFDEGRLHGRGLVAHLRGVEDRNKAAELVGMSIAIDAEALPELEDEEYYWHQLEGLRVWVLGSDGDRLLLGIVEHLMETGSSDVLVVTPVYGSLDQRERLIPYVPDQVIKSVDLVAGDMLVDWDPEF